MNWADVAVTHLPAARSRNAGYRVETTMADVAPIASVAEGNQDVMVNRLPVTHKTYFDRYGDRVELISTWYESARIGLVVPACRRISNVMKNFNEARTNSSAGSPALMPAPASWAPPTAPSGNTAWNWELLASSGPP